MRVARKAAACLDIDVAQIGRVALKLPVDLENDPILIALSVNRRNLPLRERIVERIVNILNLYAQPGRRKALDDHVGLQPALPKVGRYVDQLR